MEHSSQEPEFSREMLEAFFATETAEGIIVMDPQGVVRGWGKASEELLGWTEQEALGKSISEIFTPEDLERRLDFYELEVARADGYAEDDRWHVRKDGSRIWVTGTMSAVRARNGALRGFVKVMRDRTDIRIKIDRMEKESEALREDFQRMQLFMNTLGHELRNPLAPLSMAVHLLAAKDASLASSEAVKVIKRQIAVLKGLVDDLTDVARSQTSGFDLAIERLHVQELVREAAADLRPKAEAKGVTLTAVLQEVPTFIEGDARRLTQVVHNLVGNAIKYTPAGGTVFLKAGEEVNEIVIRIEDTGMGITPEMMPRIFDFFTQDPAAKKMAPDGLGVGLGLVRQIVESHHGVVAARSPGVNKGSEFTVRLPLRQPVNP